MAESTTLFKMLPWLGGLNTTEDPGMLQPNELKLAENVIFGVRGSRRKRPGINYDWDDQSNGSEWVVGGYDFFYGTSSKTQKKVTVTNGKKIFAYNTSGVRGSDLFAGTSWSSSVSLAAFEAINNLLVIAVDGSGNVLKKYDGTAVKDLGVYDITGDTHSNTTVDNISSATGLKVGATITGSGIPADTTITAISGTTLTISQAATATAAGVALNVRVSTPPVASIVRSHLGRLWTNDKTNLDRVHFSTTADPEEWLGAGDSGALDIGVGDGDKDGISAIFPTYKGELFVAKRTRLYRIIGQTPEEFEVKLVTSGLGCISHQSITPVDQDDMAFASERGFHSLAATASFGDFEGKFLSKDIQGDFNDKFVKSRYKYIKAAYEPSINSIIFAVTSEDYGSTFNNALYLYNMVLGTWYIWTNIECEALFPARDSDGSRFYLGSTTGRLAQTLTSTTYDVDTSGNQDAIPFVVETGLIFVDDNPYTIKGFKRFALVFRPLGPQTVTVKLKIDNYAEQSLAFTVTNSGDVLGSTFILGTSVLGSEQVLGPYALGIDGYGRGIRVRIEHSSAAQAIDIHGFMIEYEQAGTQQEVIGG